MSDRFNEIYNLYGKDVYNLSYSYVLNKFDAEDITQKTFYKLFNNKVLKRENTFIKNWLFKVCVNESKDYLKSSWFKVSKEMPETEIKDNNHGVLDSMQNIDPIYRIPLYLHYYEGYSIKEIALIMKKSESAIKMRLSRGKEELKKEMEDLK